jgi:tRNA (guanine-N7-)-methyltransferase
MPKNKLKKYVRVRQLPNVTFAGFGVSPPPGSYPWDAGRFTGMQKVLELGCGKGEHALAFARNNPDRQYVGVDNKSHRICVGAEKAMEAGLANILFLHARIERIRDFFLPNTINEIWLTFPDPYPKNQTIKFRLTAGPFLETYAHLLVPGGKVHLKTDSDMFFDFTRASVTAQGGQILAAVDDIHANDEGRSGAAHVISAYEKAARERGDIIKYMAFRLNR